LHCTNLSQFSPLWVAHLRIFKAFLQYLPWAPPPVTFHLFPLHILPPHTTISTRILSDKDILKIQNFICIFLVKNLSTDTKSGILRVQTSPVCLPPASTIKSCINREETFTTSNFYYIQGVALATEPGISLIILTPIKI
jgi:hypothetical protein